MFDELPRLGWMWWCCHCGRLGINRKWWRDLAPSRYTSSIIFQHPPSSIRRQDAEVLRRYMFPSALCATFLSSYHDFPVSSTRQVHGKYTAGIAAISRVLASRLLLLFLLPTRHSRPFSALRHENNDTSHRRESSVPPSQPKTRNIDLELCSAAAAAAAAVSKRVKCLQEYACISRSV